MRKRKSFDKQAEFNRRVVMITGVATLATTTAAFTLLPKPSNNRFPPSGHQVALRFTVRPPATNS